MSYLCQNTWISSRTQNTRKLWCLNPDAGTDAEWGLPSFGQRADGHTREEHVDLLEQRLGVAKCIRGE